MAFLADSQLTITPFFRTYPAEQQVYTAGVNLKRRRRTLAFFLGIFLFGVSAAFGQSARLHGRVLDPTGGGIAATITLFSENRVLSDSQLAPFIGS